MIARTAESTLVTGLSEMPAVALLGPRQVGKTCLAWAVAAGRPSVYLDLESPGDLAKLQDPATYLSMHADKLVILDEIQRVPDLFPVLRGLIDQARHRGEGNGRYLILGSASLELIRQSSESLAGRIRLLELGGLSPLEVGAENLDKCWLRGGFPPAFLAATDAASHAWRMDFIRTYVERDIPQFGPRLPATTLRRFWTMLAHLNGGMINASKIAAGLDLSQTTVKRYLDLMSDLLLVRRLPPWHANAGKRLVKTPKLYLRDTGLLHALLGIVELEGLYSHPVAGSSWESFVIEQILSVAPAGTQACFYRTGGGAEIDLLLEIPGRGRWAVEIKRSAAPRLERGFHEACADLQPDRKFVVYQGLESYPLRDEVLAIGVTEMMRTVASPSA